MQNQTTKLNFKEIKIRFPLVESIEENNGIFEFKITSFPVTLKIKIHRDSYNNEYPYTGITNYRLVGPRNSDPYIALHQESTIQKAVESSLDGFLRVYNLEDLDKIDFGLDPKWDKW